MYYDFNIDENLIKLSEIAEEKISEKSAEKPCSFYGPPAYL